MMVFIQIRFASIALNNIINIDSKGDEHVCIYFFFVETGLFLIIVLFFSSIAVVNIFSFTSRSWYKLIKQYTMQCFCGSASDIVRCTTKQDHKKVH